MKGDDLLLNETKKGKIGSSCVLNVSKMIFLCLKTKSLCRKGLSPPLIHFSVLKGVSVIPVLPFYDVHQEVDSHLISKISIPICTRSRLLQCSRLLKGNHILRFHPLIEIYFHVSFVFSYLHFETLSLVQYHEYSFCL